ncbi:MAG: hypothetical protein AB1411_09190 [Nitrospirota bacterium]
MNPRIVRPVLFACQLACLAAAAPGQADDPPLTRDVPIEQFQSQPRDKPYDYNAPPEGLFRTIQMAKGFEEEMGFHRSFEIVPVNPGDVFRSDDPAVYVVFSVYPHYQSFQVSGLCYPEAVPDLDPAKVIAQDAMHLTLEDDTGYIRLQAPSGGWKPGRYKVEIHVGFQVNQLSLMGTMRFSVAQSAPVTRDK